MNKNETMIYETILSHALHYGAIKRHSANSEEKKEATQKVEAIDDLIEAIHEKTNGKDNILGGYRVELVNFMMTGRSKKYYDSLKEKSEKKNQDGEKEIKR